MKVLSSLDAEFQEKLFYVFSRCKTPEQLRCAERYLQLAQRSGYKHGLNLNNLQKADDHGKSN